MSIRDPETIGVSPRAKTYGIILVAVYDTVRQDHSFVTVEKMNSAPFRYQPEAVCEPPHYHPYIPVLFR